MRVVPDTNVLISAFCFPGGAPERVFRAAIEGVIEPATSRTLLAGFARILTDEFDWELGRAEEAVVLVAHVGSVVEPSERFAVIKADPADDRVLEAAIEADASVIVSGDSHLLSLGTWRGIRILSPASLLAELE